MGRERSRWYETKEFKSATDELGFSITKDPVHVHDLNATILQVLGFDHTKIKFRHQGGNYRLTDVYGEIVQDILM